MMRSCQDIITAKANERAAQMSASGCRRQGRRLLGKGAFGIVYLDTWKSLPAAVKVVLLDPGDPERRLAQLASEVAIAANLSHPNIVTTYDFSLSAVGADDEDVRMQYRLPELVPLGPAGRIDELSLLRIRLVMQYCNGGTLKEALRPGGLLGQAQGAPALRAIEREAPPLWEQTPEEVATAAVKAVVTGAGNQEQQQAAAAATLPAAAFLGSPMSSLPHWEGVQPAPDLVLSLLAAVDILRGLEYLHAAKIVHGDLTENNVLLHSAQPVLLPAAIAMLMRQALKPLLPRMSIVPIAPLLLANASPRLPPSALALLRRCLELDPAQRGGVAEVRAAAEELLREVAGPELGELLLSAERRETADVGGGGGPSSMGPASA
ncbi:hypothetical protein GPECTOR_73g622 [Gonium pectorale]|uniref:Protein kinase domain-containing protein n=1 Tax=Gonium pectorale TaxID=33097 RepID=A0A150G2T1_GONPE|nr:hypothetical protein GPECTOR_73g622 [Gonium pectorale]|eukprot:KXZ44101.1 hypothetical protein GPECTOR_73g622 [Gonium pectorale]